MLSHNSPALFPGYPPFSHVQARPVLCRQLAGPVLRRPGPGPTGGRGRRSPRRYHRHRGTLRRDPPRHDPGPRGAGRNRIGDGPALDTRRCPERPAGGPHHRLCRRGQPPGHSRPGRAARAGPVQWRRPDRRLGPVAGPSGSRRSRRRQPHRGSARAVHPGLWRHGHRRRRQCHRRPYRVRCARRRTGRSHRPPVHPRRRRLGRVGRPVRRGRSLCRQPGGPAPRGRGLCHPASGRIPAPARGRRRDPGHAGGRRPGEQLLQRQRPWWRPELDRRGRLRRPVGPAHGVGLWRPRPRPRGA
jgi:hypothetical protein